MRSLLIATIFLSSVLRSFATDTPQNALWITGDVLMEDGLLLFRTDKSVQGNITGKVVLIGPTKDAISSMGPLLMRAAERHLKLRFYGELQPVSSAPPGHHKKVPSVQFIVWKMHAPTDPDELPPGQAIHLDPKTKIPGYKVDKPK